MALHLITGSANAGKTGLIYTRIRGALAAGQRPFLVVPSKPDAERALNELAREFPVGVRVFTFARFSESMWDRHGDGREIVTRAVREMLCLVAAREAGASAGTALLAASCAERLAESTGSTWRGGPRSGVPDEARGLADTLRRYAALLAEADLVEPAEATWLLSERTWQDESPLLIHRFADFTPSQLRLIRRWAEHGDVHVSLTWQAGFAPTVASGDLIDLLGPAKMQVVEEEQTTDDTLLSLARSLFGRPASLVVGESVRFSLAEGETAEAQRIAEEVNSALVEESASSLSDIAVVFGQVEVHYPALRQAFSEAGIQADFDVEIPFGHTPFGSAIGHAVGFASRANGSDLLALLRSPFAGVDREEARRLERRWRSEGVDDCGTMPGRLRNADKGLSEALKVWTGAADGPVSAAQAHSLADSVRWMYARAYGSEGASSGSRAEYDAWAHDTVMTTLSEVARLAPDRLHLTDIHEMLKLQSMRPRESERAGHVQVMSTSRIRGRRFETVIIGGLNVGETPRSPSEEALPGSAIDAVLGAFGGGGEAPKGIEFEQLVFYLALTRARRRLVLSAQVTDSDGEPRQVSPFFEVVCDNFRTPDEEAIWPDHAFRTVAQPPSEQAPSGSRERERARAFYGTGNDARSAAARRRAVPRRTGLSDPALLEALAGRETFSASELEAYLACPYSWFYGAAVRPRELERKAGAAEQGKFAHQLLDGVYRRLRDAGSARVTESTLDAALRELDGVFDELSATAGKPTGVRETIERQAARRWAARILADDATRYAGFRPLHLEWEFGYAGDPVVVGSFSVRGRVDRIDVDDAGRAIVIDYKRSHATKAADILVGGKVQMPLYLTAAESALGLRPIAGLYRALCKRQDRGLVISGSLPDDTFTRGDVLSGEAFRQLVDEGLALAEEAVAGIRAGRIDCDPRGRSACTHCRAESVCGGVR